MEDINQILVVSRMTRYCAKAVHYGVSLSKKYGAALTVVHVIHDPFGIEGWNLPMPNLEKDYQNLLNQAHNAKVLNWFNMRTQRPSNLPYIGKRPMSKLYS